MARWLARYDVAPDCVAFAAVVVGAAVVVAVVFPSWTTSAMLALSVLCTCFMKPGPWGLTTTLCRPLTCTTCTARTASSPHSHGQSPTAAVSRTIVVSVTSGALPAPGARNGNGATGVLTAV